MEGRVNKMWEKYDKRKKLGMGNTAEVFLVQEKKTNFYYAMKYSEKGNLLKQEEKLLKELNNPYFPCVKEYGKENGEYLVMEYIKGNNLQEILDSGKKFDMHEIVYLMDEILKCLLCLHTHQSNILFRDLKPANIMVENNGKIRLIDFGAACYGKNSKKAEYAENMIMAGTYGYAAPEQFWKGADLDERCDIYAAGKILAYLLSGKNPAIPPYDMEQYCQGLKKVPGVFQEIINRSLAINPQARYEDCETMRREIQNAYAIVSAKKLFKLYKKQTCFYEKCIWLSEYRRIF